MNRTLFFLVSFIFLSLLMHASAHEVYVLQEVRKRVMDSHQSVMVSLKQQQASLIKHVFNEYYYYKHLVALHLYEINVLQQRVPLDVDLIQSFFHRELALSVFAKRITPDQGRALGSHFDKLSGRHYVQFVRDLAQQMRLDYALNDYLWGLKRGVEAEIALQQRVPKRGRSMSQLCEPVVQKVPLVGGQEKRKK